MQPLVGKRVTNKQTREDSKTFLLLKWTILLWNFKFFFTVLENGHGVKHSSTELTPQFSDLPFKAPLYCSLEEPSLSIFNSTLGLLTYARNGTEESNTPDNFLHCHCDGAVCTCKLWQGP